MKITPKVKKHQMGGEMNPQGDTTGQPMAQDATQVAPEGSQVAEQDPITILAQMSTQAIQSQDCQMAMQVCQAFLEIVAQMQGGAPEQPQGEPVYKKGGILVRRINK